MDLELELVAAPKMEMESEAEKGLLMESERVLLAVDPPKDHPFH